MARNTPHKPLQHRLDDIERRLGVLEHLARQGQAGIAPAPVPQAASAAVSPPTPAAPRLASPMTPVPQSAPRERKPIDVERWLRWAGIALVVLAAAFLLNVAIQRGWLTPAVRVFGGLAVGIVLYVLGLLARTRSDAYATALEAGGAAVAYIMVWAGFQVFELFPLAVAGVGMLVVVAALFLDVFRNNDSTLAVLATLAGFATPFLLSTVDDTPGGPGAETAPLLGYLAFFVLLTAAVHFMVGWRTLQVVAAGAAVLSLGIAASAGETSAAQHPEAALITVGLGLIAIAYWLVPTVARDRIEASRALRSPVSEIAGSLDDALGNLVRLSGFVLLGITLAGVTAVWDLDQTPAGFVALGLAALAGAVGYLVRTDTNGYINGLLASLFVTIGLALLLDGEVRMITLAAQGVVLLLIAERITPPTPLRVQAHLLTAIATIAMLIRLLDGYWESGLEVVLSSLAVIGIIGLGGWRQEQAGRAAYLLTAYGSGLLLIRHLLGGTDVGLAFVTASWAIIGLGLVLFGRFGQARPLELTGLGTLGVVVIRLFGHLEDIDPLIRVFLFLAIGVLFLGGGWYARGGRTTRPSPPTADATTTPDDSQ